MIQNGLVNRLDARAKVDELRAMPPPYGVRLLVGGTPALEQDSVATISAKLPMMILIAVSMTTLLMFLAFGSLVLPIKAALMNALTLCSTLGVLTWIFVDGHGASLLNFTPTPLTAPVVGLIIAVIFGLSTDYEVFLGVPHGRGPGARHDNRGGHSPRHGDDGPPRARRHWSSRVGGAFAFSDLVMMQYLAIGLMTALLLDATVVRMFLVPSVMKLLGNDCWWAPRWMKRVQETIGLSEMAPDEDEGKPSEAPEHLDEVLVFGTVVPSRAWPTVDRDPSRPAVAAAVPSGGGVALATMPSTESKPAPKPRKAVLATRNATRRGPARKSSCIWPEARSRRREASRWDSGYPADGVDHTLSTLIFNRVLNAARCSSPIPMLTA